VLKFRNGAYVQAIGTGQILAVSTPDAPIVFTSFRLE